MDLFSLAPIHFPSDRISFLSVTARILCVRDMHVALSYLPKSKGDNNSALCRADRAYKADTPLGAYTLGQNGSYEAQQSDVILAARFVV